MAAIRQTQLRRGHFCEVDELAVGYQRVLVIQQAIGDIALPGKIPRVTAQLFDEFIIAAQAPDPDFLRHVRTPPSLLVSKYQNCVPENQYYTIAPAV